MPGTGFVSDGGDDKVPPPHGRGESRTGTAKWRESYAQGTDQKNASQSGPPRDPPKVILAPKTDFEDEENHFAMWVDADNHILLNEDHRILTEQSSGGKRATATTSREE